MGIDAHTYFATMSCYGQGFFFFFLSFFFFFNFKIFNNQFCDVAEVVIIHKMILVRLVIGKYESSNFAT